MTGRVRTQGIGPFNSSPPSAAYMRQWTGPSLVQVMAWRRIGDKLAYCQLDSWEQISVKFESEFCHFRSRKCIWTCRLPKWRPFCPEEDELSKGVVGTKPLHVTIITNETRGTQTPAAESDSKCIKFNFWKALGYLVHKMFANLCRPQSIDLVSTANGNEGICKKCKFC